MDVGHSDEDCGGREAACGSASANDNGLTTFKKNKQRSTITNDNHNRTYIYDLSAFRNIKQQRKYHQ